MFKVLLFVLFCNSVWASPDFIILEGDIAVKKGKDKSSFLRSAERWPGGVIPWTLDTEDENNRSLIKALKGAMDTLNNETNLVFKKRTSKDQNYLVFTSKDKGCFSYVGMQGGRQEVNLSKGCYVPMIAAHEILHAIGMEHEQSREDRDDFLTVLWENIEENQKHNFDKVPRSNFGEYNLNSIMHYDSYSFSKNGKPSMVTKDGKVFGRNIEHFTEGDKEAVNNFYPFKFNFVMEKVGLNFEQQGGNFTQVQLKTDAEIIKSIESVTYQINGTEFSNEITTWDNNFQYNFDTKKGKNLIHVIFKLKDGTTEEADYTYFYTGRKLEVVCLFVTRRNQVEFKVPISFEGEEPKVESRDLKDYFSKASAVFDTQSNILDLQMVVGREAGIFRKEEKDSQVFQVIENGTHKVQIDKAELSCQAINEAL